MCDGKVDVGGAHRLEALAASAVLLPRVLQPQAKRPEPFARDGGQQR